MNETCLVALYCRLSDEDKQKAKKGDDSESIKNQRELLLRYCEVKNLKVYDIYVDDDYSGSDRGRPDFNRMIEDAKLHKFDMILAKTQARFARDSSLIQELLYDKFLEWNIYFKTIVDNIDTTSIGTKKSSQIIAMSDEWYLEDLSRNIRTVFENKKIQGHHIGSFAVYGYKKDPKQKGHLVIDEEAAEIVRQIFSLYAQGYGKTNIARILNESGIPNPSEYKRQKGLRYKHSGGNTGTLWKYFSINNVLHNEMYIGNMVQNKQCNISYKNSKKKQIPKSDWIIVKETHEPIIDIELWDTVQKKLKQKFKSFGNGKIGLFAYKVKCMNCHASLRSSKNRGKHYLKCETRFFHKEACQGAFISVEKLEKEVIKQLNQLNQELNCKNIEKGISLNNDLHQRIEKLKREIKKLNNDIEKTEQYLKQSYIDRLNGLISEYEYKKFSDDFQKERNTKSEQINEYKNKINELEKRLKNANERAKIVKRYINVEKLDRTMVEILIDTIYVGTNDRKNKIQPIKIEWNF